MSYLRNPLQREKECMCFCVCVCVHEVMRGGGPKKHFGQDVISNQSEMEKCKLCWLQQYENDMKSREIIDFTNEMSYHFLMP